MGKIVCDPRDLDSDFGQLFQEIRECKKNKTCKELTKRPYFFEPNPETAVAWKDLGMFTGDIDTRVVFVCESPGSLSKSVRSLATRRCWANTARRVTRFHDVRSKYGFQNCLITNAVKCGVRKGSKHSDEEASNCSHFVMKELELIKPLVVVGVGNNAMYYLRNFVLPNIAIPPVLFQIAHYSVRRDPWKYWDKEFPELTRLLARLRPRSEWGL